MYYFLYLKKIIQRNLIINFLNLYINKIVANFDLIPRTTARVFDLQGWNFNMYCAILWRWYINFFKVIDQLVWAWDGKMCSDSAQFCRHHLNFWGHPTFPIHLRTTMVRVNFQNFVLKWILLRVRWSRLRHTSSPIFVKPFASFLHRHKRLMQMKGHA